MRTIHQSIKISQTFAAMVGEISRHPLGQHPAEALKVRGVPQRGVYKGGGNPLSCAEI